MVNHYFALLVAYMLGSLPFAYLISQFSHCVDPRMVGDGNPGAKNVFFQVGHAEGILVGLFDISKGISAVILGRALDLNLGELLMVGFAAIVGHDWSIFLKFHGGQGMATTIGVLMALAPLSMSVAILVIALVLFLKRNWDLSCGIGLSLFPVAAWICEGKPSIALYSIVLLPIIGVRKWMQTSICKDYTHQD